MTQEEKQEKARELAIKYCKDIDPHGKEVYNIGCAIACCEMADWADQHPREGLWDAKKVIKYINDVLPNYVELNCVFDEIQVNYNKFKNNFIHDLKKAMED